jgi:acyl carrier protein
LRTRASPTTITVRSACNDRTTHDSKGQITEDLPVPTREEILEKVREIVSEQMGVDKSEINMETSFVNDLNADSLDTVELVMELEDEFDMSIPDEEAEKLQTVGSAVEFIEKQIEAKG